MLAAKIRQRGLGAPTSGGTSRHRPGHRQRPFVTTLIDDVIALMLYFMVVGLVLGL